MFVPKGENTYKVYEQGNAIRKTIDYGDYWLKESDYLRLKNFSIKTNFIYTKDYTMCYNKFITQRRK